ncbi:MAG: 2-polyprenylphenol 6-hydroxylase [Candidatus Eutrophobiaceae bacterium]
MSQRHKCISFMRNVLRIIAIQRILFDYGLDREILASPSLRALRVFLLLFPWNWRRTHAQLPLSQRLRLMLEALGPLFVKFGQGLSTRRDLIPEEMANELAMLQDHVYPFPGEQAKDSVELQMQRPVHEVFSEFDLEPLASASISQVHAAKLLDGRECIVKVVRPDVEQNIRRDLDLIYFIAEHLERVSPANRSLNFPAVVKELERTVLRELDFQREAANASQLRRNFAHDPHYYVPEVYWEWTSKNILVMERIHGIPVSDTEALRKAQVDLRWLAEYGVQIFFTQVFRDNYFHADMHPGNIFVDPGDEQRPRRVIVVDFGVMSSLSEFDQRYLAENFMAFLDHDYRKVADLHIKSSWVPEGTRVDELESSVRMVCEPLLARPMRESSFGALLESLFRVAQGFQVEIMPQLLLLQKTIINVEGIGRQLHPDLDLWKVARPQLERWMKERMGLKAFLKNSQARVPQWLEQLPELPGNLLELTCRLRENRLGLTFKSRDVAGLRRELRYYYQRAIRAILGSGLLICATVLYVFDRDIAVAILGIPPLSWLFGGIGIWLIARALRAI